MPLRSKLLLFVCHLAVLFNCFAVLPVYGENFRNPRRIPLSVDPTGVTTGDVNGDGRNDIVWTETVAFPIGAKLHILLAAANGQYTSAPDLSLPFSPLRVFCVVEDVTGDKRNDLVCAASSTNLTDVFLITYPGLGDGTFAAPVQTRIVSQAPFSNPFLARAGDLNKDGFLDLIVMDAAGGVLSYLSDGKGGFKPGATIQGSFNYSVPTVADLNGDGKLDILWPTGPRVNLGNGDGTFSAITQYDPGFLSNCAFGDVDGDGHPDAACAWYDGSAINGRIHLAVLHGNSDGSFSKSPLFTRTFGNGDTVYDGVPTMYIPVLIADLNGDGLADIVSLSGDGYCVLLGGANATWNGQPQQFVTASLSSEGGLSGIYGVSIADMNGDSLPDIVAIGPNGLYITYAQRDGTLSSAPAPEVGQLSTSATLVDIDGDGNLDVVSAGDTALKLSLGHGDGTFGPPQPITSTGNFGRANYILPGVISGDFNGDGQQDLIATGSTGPYVSQTYMLFGHGGAFDTPRPVAISLGKVADLNNDGRSDVYSVRANSDTTTALVANLSRGDGTFTTISTNLPAGTGISSAVGDFRHVGFLDAAVASINNVYPLRGHGDGTFDSTGVPLPIPGLQNLNRVSVVDLSVGDFDKDGNLDIVVLAQYGTGGVFGATPTAAAWVFYGNGDGTFSAAVLAGTFNRNAATISAGDLNGDGLADLVLTSDNTYQDNGVLVVHALANRTWGPEVDYTGGEGLSPLWITDINHDGRNDLIFSNAQRLNLAASSISVLLNLPDATLTGALTASPEPSYTGSPFTLRAVLAPVNANDTLAGTVTFSLDGSLVGTAPLIGNTASLSLTGTGVDPGTHNLLASWAGDSTYPAITLSGKHTVQAVRADTAMTLTSSASPVAAATPVTFTAHVTTKASTTNTGALVTFSDGANVLGTAAIDASGNAVITVTNLAVGTHTITAALAQTATLNASSASVSEVITKAPTAIVLTGSPNPVYQNQSLTLNVTLATPPGFPASGTVQVLDGVLVIGTGGITSNAATLNTSALTVGTHTLTATYSGDTNTLPATSDPLIITVLASDFVLSSTPSTLALQTEHHLTFSVAAQSTGTFADQLTFSASNLPAHMKIVFASTTMKLTAGGNAALSVYIDTDDVRGYARAVPPETPFARRSPPVWALVPVPFLLYFIRRRQRHWTKSIVVMLALAVGMLSGCSSVYPGSTAPGTYTVQLQAVGSASGLAHTLNLQVVVLP